jgi:hypothetical protein
LARDAVSVQPRRRSYLSLKVDVGLKLQEQSFVVDAIEGEVVRVKTADDHELTVSVPPILLA